MKVAHVAVYMDAEQAEMIRSYAQVVVLAADEDLELTQKPARSSTPANVSTS